MGDPLLPHMGGKVYDNPQKGATADVAQHIASFLTSRQSAFAAARIEPAAECAAADWHRHAWAWCKPSSAAPQDPITLDTEILTSEIGARQGDRLGAIVFNFTYELMLSNIRQELRAENLVDFLDLVDEEVPWLTKTCQAGPAEPVETSQTTYVDDNAQLLSDPVPEELIRKLIRTIEIADSVFRRFGLQLNFGPDKTAVMLQLYGKTSRKEYEKIRTESGSLAIPTAAGMIDIVHAYKHVGVTHQTNQRHILDARQKVQKASLKYAPLAGNLYSAKNVKQHIKANLTRSLIDSGLTYGLELWLSCDPTAMRKVNAMYMRPRRRAIAEPRFSHTDVSDQQCLDNLRHLNIDMHVVTKRFALLRNILVGPKQLRAIFSACPKPPAADLFLEDLRLLWDHCEVVQHLPDPFEEPAPWKEFIIDQPHKWANVGMSLLGVPPRRHHVATPLPPLECQDPDLAPDPSNGGGELQCNICSKWCRGWRGLASHKRLKHNLAAEGRKFCISSICPACGKNFQTRPRALHHLQYSSKRCKAQLRAGSLHEFSTEEVQEADQKDIELTRADVRAGRGRLVAHIPATM